MKLVGQLSACERHSGPQRRSLAIGLVRGGTGFPRTHSHDDASAEPWDRARRRRRRLLPRPHSPRDDNPTTAFDYTQVQGLTTDQYGTVQETLSLTVHGTEVSIEVTRPTTPASPSTASGRSSLTYLNSAGEPGPAA